MPIRMLRDWTDSEKVNVLSSQAERFFIRLIMKVDDFGNYPANLKYLNGNLFPLAQDIREIDVAHWLDECVHAGLIDRYDVDDKKYINVRNFGQRLDRARSKFPLPHESGNASDNGQPIGYVYIIGTSFDEPVKIGHSINPWARLKELSTADRKEYSMIGTFRGAVKDERAIHKLLRELLRDSNIRGEWFNIPSDTVVAIRSSIDTKETAIQLLERIRSSIVVELRKPVVDRSPAELETETEYEIETEKEKPLRAGGKKIVIDNLFPLGTPEHNAWEEWRQYRKEIKKTLSPSTAKKQMQFLGGRAGPEIVEIINQSIKNGWTGLFPLKTEQNGNHAKGTNGTTSAQIAGTRYTGSKL